MIFAVNAVKPKNKVMLKVILEFLERATEVLYVCRCKDCCIFVIFLFSAFYYATSEVWTHWTDNCICA